MLPEIVWTRPWLWLSLPIFCFAIYLFQRARVSQQQAFSEWFDPHLFHYLSKSTPSIQKRWVAGVLYFSALCLTIFLAGPALVMKDSERFMEKRGAAIVLDLGLHSLATDLVPNRLQQAKYKIEDLLTLAPNYEYGIVVVANDAFVITPMSPDSSTLINQLKSLHPNILPIEPLINDVSKLDKGVESAKQLLQGSGFYDGVIIVISYNPSDQMLDNMVVSRDTFELVYWQFGNEQGGPIKLANEQLIKDEVGNIVISNATPPQSLPNEVIYLPTSPNNQDIDQINSLIGSQDTQLTIDLDNQFEMLTPIDSYFLFPILVIILIFVRRPNLVLSSYMLVTLLFIPDSGFTQENVTSENNKGVYSVPVMDIPLSWRPNSLMTKDQLGMKYFNQYEYSKTLEIAQSATIKSMASLAMNDFELAKQLLNEPQSAIDHYHLGLAHFALKEYQQALTAFENAMRNNPNMLEAQDNYDALKRFLEQDDNKQNQNDQSEQGEQQSNSQNESAQTQQQQEGNDSQGENSRTNDTPISGRDERQRASKSGGSGSQSEGESSVKETEKSNFFDDLFISKDKTHGDVEEQDIVQTELFGNLKNRPPLDLEGIQTVVRKVPDNPDFLLKQRLKLIHQRRQQEQHERQKLKHLQDQQKLKLPQNQAVQEGRDAS